MPSGPDAPSQVQQPDPTPRPGEVTLGFGVDEREIDETLDTLVPLAVPAHGLLFFDPKLSISNRMDPSVSLGFGYRHLFEGPQIIVGGNIFYDSYVVGVTETTTIEVGRAPKS